MILYIAGRLDPRCNSAHGSEKFVPREIQYWVESSPFICFSTVQCAGDAPSRLQFGLFGVDAIHNIMPGVVAVSSPMRTVLCFFIFRKFFATPAVHCLGALFVKKCWKTDALHCDCSQRVVRLYFRSSFLANVQFVGILDAVLYSFQFCYFCRRKNNNKTSKCSFVCSKENPNLAGCSPY